MRRRPTRAIAVIGALGLLGVAGPAVAEIPCGAGGRAVVELVLEVDPPDRIIGTTLEQHLRAELGAREIDVCMAPKPTASPSPAPLSRPIARVTLHVDHPANGAFLATIQVGDLIMDKRVERTIDLRRIPADGRPLAVAAATDELLRASWAELLLADAPVPSFAPPPAVTHALAAPARPARTRPSLVEIGAVGRAVDLFGHRVGLGGEGWIGVWFLPRLALDLRFVADRGLPRASADGTARADTFGPGATVVVALRDHDAPMGARLEGGAELLRVHLVGTTSDGARTAAGSHWSGLASATVRGWARTGPIAWTLGVGAVAALHAVAATDNGVAVTSIEGFGGRLDAGIMYSFH